MKLILFILVFFIFVYFLPIANSQSVPDWVKNTAGWWSTDTISETEFVNAMEFLIKNDIINVTSSSSTTSTQSVPDWVKNTAGWWSTDTISETEFVNAMEFLVKNGIIQIELKNFLELDSCQFSHIPALKNLSLEEKKDICTTLQLDYLDKRVDCSPCEHSIEYNSYGFRGPEITKIKPDNTYRIFLVGGSTLANTEYADELYTTKGQMLEKINDLDLGMNFEIINVAIASAKSWHELQLSEEKLYEFNPDMIIHYTSWNDITAEIHRYDWVSPVGNQAVAEKWISQPNEFNSDVWFTNFKNACEEREKIGIKTVIGLQPFVGTGKRIMTDQEIDFYLHFGNGRHLEIYPTYLSKIPELEKYCFAVKDLTGIFDPLVEPIYRDGGHTMKKGMKVVADNLLYLALPDISPEIDPDKIFNVNQSPQKHIIDVKEKFKNVGSTLIGTDFSDQQLQNSYFFGSNLKNSDFSNSNLAYSNFELADLENAQFVNANVEQIKLKRAILFNTDFSGVDFSNVDLNFVDFRSSNLEQTNFKNSDLKNTGFVGANLKNADFSNAQLSYSDIGRYNFLDGANIKNTNFSGANLMGIDLTKIKNQDITGTNFEKTSLAYADLRGLDLTGQNFSNTNFKGAKLSGLDFSNVKLEGTLFPFANLEYAKFNDLTTSNLQYSFTVPIENISDKQPGDQLFGSHTIIGIHNLDEKFVHVDTISLLGFYETNLKNSEFKNSILPYSIFYEADLSGANLTKSNFSYANFIGAILIDANLSNTNLHGADLARANLSDTNLRGAVLSNAYLVGADLRGADLSGANLLGAVLDEIITDESTKFP